MSIHVAIRHTTRYTFDRRVTLSPHIVRLRPAPHSRTPIVSYSLKVRPDKHFINWQQDPFGNYMARLVFPEATRELLVDVEVIADLTVINPFDFFMEDRCENWPFDYDAAQKKELTPYLETEPPGPLFQAWLASVPRDTMRTIDFLVMLNQRLQQEIAYTVRLEPGVQTPEETLDKALGSCRDTGWLLVQALRHLGLAARFVSGYLVQLAPDEKSLDGPSGPETDFTDLHAWAEVYVPGAGWIGLDPTSGLFASEGHIPLAATPQPSSAAPIEGFTDKCEVSFEFSNTVTRFREDPRVTLPYSDAQWAAIEALGHQVDEVLLHQDVRLTHGGEPTFVSIDDMDAPEWNTAAHGSHKRERAEVLVRRLKQRLAPGALLHTGQGKWYPGEPLPRWALGLYWRRDGQPIWHNPALLAEADWDYGHTHLDAQRFAETLALHLGLASRYVQPAYEDALAALLQEAELPPNLGPGYGELDDAGLRGDLASKLSRGLNTPTGYVLPLAWSVTTHDWMSAPWDTRRDRLYLLPGDSPMGLRLPLKSLPWVAEDEREPWVEVDPFAVQPPLADFHGEIAARFSALTPPVPPVPPTRTQPQHAPHTVAVEVPRTALSVEARSGCLFVFMPPLATLERYLELVAALETTATKLALPIAIEGYTPPADSRIEKLLVTPDPGVIEVNIHPAHSWSQLVDTTTLIYEEARLSRLAAEKFMLDGRHAGTGGGNHVTLGGATPADSPFLRRPDLLASLVTYWQHHPALSYLFSGLFIGPTSQAPRVDEGRIERLYELEIAFQQMPAGNVPQPWLVDRLLRNLLIDLTGFRPGTWTTPDAPHTQTARLIAEGELGPALARLPDVGGIHGLWRAYLLARLGHDEGAAEALTLALRGIPDFTLADAPHSPGEEATRARFSQLILHDADPFHRVARDVLGPALNDVYALLLAPGMVLRPEVIRHLLVDLDPHPLAPPTTHDPLVKHRHCTGLLLRGTAWRAAGRGDLARRDLEVAWQMLDDDTRDIPDRKTLRKHASRALLELGVAAGDAVAARRWLMIQLADSETPEITLEIWRDRPDLQVLLDADTWAELARAADSPERPQP